jgi:DNA uptake protein ComE-like DNA-binding protein
MKQRILHWLRFQLGLSTQESNAFIVVSLLIILILALTMLTGMLSGTGAQSKPAQIAQDKAWLDSVLQDTNRPVAATEELSPTSLLPFPAISLFPFDPNQIGIAQWEALGLSPAMAQRIENYKSKGGRFKIKSDLLKIYNFPENTYRQLAPYIQLPEQIADTRTDFRKPENTANKNKTDKEEKTEYNPAYKKPAPEAFNLNTADTAQLKQIRGIGSVLSERIVKYRDRLGGFHHTSQLEEVYGLKPEVIQELLRYSFIDKEPSLKLIHINIASAEELQSHPYLSRKIAEVLVAYRKQHGFYKKTDDLLKTQVVSDELLQKISPYLSFTI